MGKSQRPRTIFCRLDSGKSWLHVYFSGGRKANISKSLRNHLFNLIPITWLIRTKRDKLMKSPTWTSFIDLTLMESTFHGYRLCPKPYPTCNCGPTAVGNKLVQVRLYHRESPSHYQKLKFCAHHCWWEATISPSKAAHLHWISKQFGYLVPPVWDTYMLIYTDKKKSTHTAGCEMFPFLLLIQNYD